MRRRAPVLAVTATAVLLAGGLVATGPDAVRAALSDLGRGPSGPACPPSRVTADRYDDVAPTSPHELAIGCVADHALLDGVSGDAFDPDAPATREDVTGALARLADRAGVPAPTLDEGPATPSRGELAVGLHRLAGAAGVEPDGDLPDAFDDDEDLPAEPALDALAALGVADSADGAFEPGRPATRAELAGLLAALLEVLVAEGRADAVHTGDPAPVRVELAQDGRLVPAGSELTGTVRGDRVAAASLTSPCVGTVPLADADAGEGGLQWAVETDRQSAIGRCPVTVDVVLANGRTVQQQRAVVMPGFTGAPEMVHVERVGTSTAEGHATSEVRFLFDSPARLVTGSAEDAGRFTLTTYDVAGSHIATSVRQDGPSAAVAVFGTAERPVGAAELREVSHATAFRGAMRDPAGRPTPTGTAHLNPRTTSTDAYRGPRWAADLLSVGDVRPDPDRDGAFLADFLLDRVLEPTATEPAFDVLLADASGRRCRPVAPLPARRVTVSCAGDAQDVRVSRGIVSASGYASDEPLAGSLLTRRPTAAPDLVDVRWGPAPEQVTLRFDEPVEVGSADRVVAEGPYGPATGRGTSAAVTAGDPAEVVVTLRGQRLDRSTLVTTRGGAVTSRATGTRNAFEQVAVAPRVPDVLAVGRTVLPDLMSIAVDADGVARYEYDAALPPTRPGFAPVEDLSLYLYDGTELVCRGPRVVPGTFPDADGPVSALACADFRVGSAAGPAAPAEQVRTALYGTASYGTPPEARVVEGARR